MADNPPGARPALAVLHGLRGRLSGAVAAGASLVARAVAHATGGGAAGPSEDGPTAAPLRWRRARDVRPHGPWHDRDEVAFHGDTLVGQVSRRAWAPSAEPDWCWAVTAVGVESGPRSGQALTAEEARLRVEEAFWRMRALGGRPAAPSRRAPASSGRAYRMNRLRSALPASASTCRRT